jgi:hypothetical protein
MEVNFTEEQRELIQKVISHPNLDDIISWHGLTLVYGFWKASSHLAPDIVC